MDNLAHYQRRLGTVEQELAGAENVLKDHILRVENAMNVLADEIARDPEVAPSADGARILTRLGEIAREVAALKLSASLGKF